MIRFKVRTLDVKYIPSVANPDDDGEYHKPSSKQLQSIIAQLLRKNKLIASLPEILAKTALKRFTAIGRQKYFIDDIETDDHFLHYNKRNIEIDENLWIKMKKGIETLSK